MLTFKDITPADRAVITSYTLRGERRSCDLSFSNLCSWRTLFHSQYALWQGWLLLRYRAEGRLVYTLPLGGGDAPNMGSADGQPPVDSALPSANNALPSVDNGRPSVDNGRPGSRDGLDQGRSSLRAVVEVLMADARSQGVPFCLAGINEEMIPRLEQAMPGRFTFSCERDYADYLYLRRDLASLAGRRLQPKRNHINQFLRRYPQYEYLTVTPAHIGECLRLEDEWYQANPAHWHEGAEAERAAVCYALRHWEVLGLTGGLLRVEGRTVAFTFGMPINGDTFGVHAEKADARVEGAYAMINREFARRIPERFTYVNREEDLGIAGLRQAKLSYHPVKLLNKYHAVLKEEEGSRQPETSPEP